MTLSASLLALSLGLPVSVIALSPATAVVQPDPVVQPESVAQPEAVTQQRAVAQLTAQSTSPKTSLTPAQANAAAQILLDAIADQDAETIHKHLSDSVRASTSPAKISAKLKTRPGISSSRIVDVNAGLDDTTVNAVVMTANGEEPLVLVLDDNGKLHAWRTGEILPLEQAAIDFVKDLSSARWVSARSRMSIGFQKDFVPQDLERKWNKLVRVSGGFEKVKDAIVANQGGEQQLVLVTVEFGNVTDNLFVIFDGEGKVINVDIGKDFV